MARRSVTGELSAFCTDRFNHMSKQRWLAVSLICSLIALPAVAPAQSQAQDTTNFLGDLRRGLAAPNWNVFVHGGVTTGDRFLLVQAADPNAGQRSLQTQTGWNVGGGIGVDAMLHLGLRATYTFTSSQMNFKTDNGDGSHALDINDVARLKSSTVALEALRYMMTSRAPISPYGGFGVQFTWWSLDEKSTLVTSNGAGTPLSISPVATFGIQGTASDHWSARVEAVLAGGHNPFTGNKSFRAFAGPIIDEPGSVSQTSYRLAVVYHFGSAKRTASTTTTTRRRR
jgi:hypothetical protein